MVEFKLFGIPVRVEPAFWITLGLLGFISSNIRAENGLLLIALFVLAGFLSILIHEMGHALTIRYFKLPTQVVLSSFGGYASYPAGVLTRVQSFLVTAAGPGLQVAAAFAVLFAIKFVDLPNTMISHFVAIFIMISFFWAIINCIPVLPLDGGQMLAAIMGPRRRRAVHLVSVITAVLVGCLALYTQHIFGAAFMGMFAYQNYQSYAQLRS